MAEPRRISSEELLFMYTVVSPGFEDRYFVDKDNRPLKFTPQIRALEAIDEGETLVKGEIRNGRFIPAQSQAISLDDQVRVMHLPSKRVDEPLYRVVGKEPVTIAVYMGTYWHHLEREKGRKDIMKQGA